LTVAGAAAEAARMTEHEDRVHPDWIDANGHMNLAYYVVVFDRATDVLFDRVGVGAAYRQASRFTMFAVEMHTIYERELSVGDPLLVRSVLLGADRKRLHFGHEMFHAAEGYRAAVQELMTVHVDTEVRRSAAFGANLAASLADLVAAAGPAPDWVGRRIALPASR
jgi:acyl-CoA thioester hydrolase